MKRAALWATVLLLSACGSGGTPTAAGPSPGATATALSSPTPAALCTPSNRCLALVTLRGSNDVVVRDITDIAHPKTVGNLGPSAPFAQFVDSTRVSFTVGSSLVRAPLSGSPQTAIASFNADRWLLFYTWSPDGNTAAYVSNSTAGSELHMVTGGTDRTFSSMPTLAGGCETSACSDTSDFRLLYSPDGRYISMMQSLGGPNFQLWTTDGTLVTSSPSGFAYNMSVWSRDGLYFVDGSGVVVWRGGTISSFLPGVRWIRPKASPAGGQIVYMTRDSHRLSHVYIVDTATRNVREIKSGRAEPVFLTPRFVWYKGERACSTCDPDLPVAATGTSYIYDLQTSVESTSIIAQVYDVWPHAA